MGMRIIGGRVPLVSFRGSLFSDTINTRTYSETIDLGTEAASRMIVVGTACLTAGGEAPTECTVDGVSAALAVEIVVGGTTELPAQLWYVSRPTGGSVTVAFAKPDGADMDRGAFGVWAVYYLKSAVPVAVNSDEAHDADLDLAVPSNAAIFAVGNRGVNATTWGYTGVAPDAESDAQLVATFAHVAGVPGGTPDIGLSDGLMTGTAIRAVSAAWR